MTNIFATTDRTMYGATETNGLVNPTEYHDAVDRTRTYQLSDKAVVKIIRLRLLTDPGFPFWDLSYCHGRLADGTIVPVQLDTFQFSKAKKLNVQLVEMCKRAGRYGKDLGIFDAVSIVK